MNTPKEAQAVTRPMWHMVPALVAAMAAGAAAAWAYFDLREVGSLGATPSIFALAFCFFLIPAGLSCAKWLAA